MLNVSIVQTGSMPENRQAAIEYLIGQFRAAAGPETDVVLFSELCNTPYFGLTGYDRYKEWAEPLDGQTGHRFCRRCPRTGTRA